MTAAPLDALALLESLATPLRRAAALLAEALVSAQRCGSRLPAGRSMLGDFALLVTEPETAASDALPFEVHARCADIHVVLEGYETYECADIGHLVLQKPWEKEDDASLYAGSVGTRDVMVLGPGQAVVFLPGEAHKPRVTAVRPEGGSRPRLRKAVLKVPLYQ